MTCRKKSYKTQVDAILQHQLNIGNQTNIKPFMAYICPTCSKSKGKAVWHITTRGFSQELREEVGKMIKAKDSNATLLSKYAKHMEEWRVNHSSGDYHVLYNRRNDNVDIDGTYLPEGISYD